MRRVPLAGSGLTVSELGLGCSSFWAKSAFPEKRALHLVEAALERGVKYFDTGPSYAGGQAERRLGLVLQNCQRKNVVISTKAGSWVPQPGMKSRDFSPDRVRQGLYDSLTNIGTDYIDILYLHAPTPNQITEELIGCLEDFISKGLVRTCGINGYSDALLDIAIRNQVFSNMMFDYNLLRSERLSDIDKLATAGRAFIASTPLAQGYFSNKMFSLANASSVWYLARALVKHRDMVRRGFKFRFVNEIEGWSGGEVALAYVLANRNVTSAVFGTTSMHHLLENIGTTDKVLSNDLIARINAI